MRKLRDQVWVLIGDEYDLTHYDRQTPCRVKGKLVYLGELQDKDHNGDFDLSLGGKTWTKVCLTKEQNLLGRFEVRGSFTSVDTDALVGVLQEAVNSEDCKAKLEALGVKTPKVWLHLLGI